MAMFLLTVMQSGPRFDRSKPLDQQSDWPAHARFMNGLVADGFLLLGGPIGDGPRVVHAVQAESPEAIRDVLRRDPWSGSHLVIDSIEPWTILLDARAGAG